MIGSQVNLDRAEQTTEKLSCRSRGAAGRIIGTIVLVLLASTSAFGQFLLQPMKIQVQVQPMKRFSTDIALDNLSRNTTETIGLRLVDITQRPDSVWQDISPDDPNVDRSNLRSCVGWLSLDRDTVEVGPVGRESVKLKIEVPPGTRGYYFAAVVARSSPRLAEVEGYTTTTILEYVVPVILEVQGRPMRHQVSLTGVALEFRPQTASEQAATLVAMDVSNTGGTYSRLTGQMRISGLQEGHWRKIAETQVTDIGIIPGVKLHLTRPIDRPLGSGKYKVEAFLYVDAQRSDRFEKELDFKGDPRVARTVGGLTPIDVQTSDRKPDLFIDTLPGAVRAQPLTVINASEETVVITADVALPEHMINARTATGIPGEAFGCADWVTVEPRQFTLKGYARQNLRVTTRMPNPPGPVPDYYGVIRLTAAYPDGQRSGLTKMRVVVHNRNAQGSPRVDKIVYTIAESTPSRYVVTARFANNGNTHVAPKCRAVLTVAADNTVRDRIVLTSEAIDQSAILLPLEMRNYSGVLDISSVPAGIYRLTAILEYGKGISIQDQIAIDIVEQGGNKSVQVIDASKIGGKTTVPTNI